MEHQEAIPRHPLAWPMGWKRAQRRIPSTFSTKQSADRRLSVFAAIQRLEQQLDLLGARNPTLSTNVSLRLDGRPRSDEEPRDPGAAVYFSFKGKATVFACDRYTRVADNIAAIAAHIDALRRIDRYGVGSLEQALAGYKALPADSAADWRAVFGFPADSRPTIDQVEDAFYAMAKERHPDKGGTEEGMQQINRAREFAYAELKG
jgi:hypothetical protein